MKKGSITIYFCIIFTIIVSLICTLLESSRVYYADSRAKRLTYIATESQFAGYARELFDEYGVLAIWEDNNLEDEITNMINLNNMKSSYDEGCIDMDRLNLVDVSCKNTYVTDNGGDEFVQQILEYEKYQATEKLVENLINCYKQYETSDARSVTKVDASDEYEDVTEGDEYDMQQLVDDINDCVKTLKEYDLKELSEATTKIVDDIEDNSESTLTKKSVKRLKKYIKEIRKNLKEIEKDNDELCKLIEDYHEKESKGKQEVKNELKDVTSDVGKKSKSAKFIKKNYKITKQIDENIQGINKAVEELENSIDTIDKKTAGNICNAQIGELVCKIDSGIGRLRCNKVSKEDKKNKSIFEQAKDLLDSGILELVLPEEMEVSTLSIDQSELPSSFLSESKEAPLGILQNRALFTLYINNNFNDALTCNDDTALAYEMEYIIAHQENDKSNLATVIEEIVLIRQVFNTAFLLRDSAKMATCTAVATGTCSAIGLPFLIPIVKVILIQAWAFAESISDAKILLAGGSVPILKDISDWKTSLTTLLTEPVVKVNDNNKYNLSMNYSMYLNLLLLLKSGKEMTANTMDLIQSNIAHKYNSDFELKSCITSTVVTTNFTSSPLFIRIPMISTNAGKNYEFTKRCRYNYLE